MNRRNIIITSVILLLVLSGTAFWYFSLKTPSTGNDGQFPGGSTGATGGVQSGIDTGTGEGSDIATLPRLYELHKVPVAGSGFTENKDKKGVITSIAARYVEKSLGNIFQTDLGTYKESRIVNETRPRISEALWGNNGNSVVVRFVDDKKDGAIQTRTINIEAPGVSFSRSTSTESLSPEFQKTEEVIFPDFVPFLATAEDGTNNIFYFENGINATIGTLASFKNTNASKIFTSSFTEWLPQFPSQKVITLSTRPSSDVPGHLFFLDTKTKSLSKILGGINGLTTLTSHDGKYVLYSESVGGTLKLFLYNVAQKASQDLFTKTLPEKCAWGVKNPTIAYCAIPKKLTVGSYPDQWYQGVVSFSDDIWEINAITFAVTKILSPESEGAPALDIINPVLSSDDTYLLFMNKITSTPWLYNIAEHTPPAVTTATPTFNTSSVTTPVPESAITSDMQKLK